MRNSVVVLGWHIVFIPSALVLLEKLQFTAAREENWCALRDPKDKTTESHRDERNRANLVDR